MTDYRIDGLFTLRAPLSHIGEVIGTTSYLVEDSILQPDGTVAEVFCYSGNAWRGQLRDLMASYMLDRLGGLRVGLDAFHLLFSGGRIGGEQSVDIEQARRMRAAIPLVSLLGGGVGNQILQGKLVVGNCYPLCREALAVLPQDLREAAGRVPYSSCTMQKEHSRRDDTKVEAARRHLPDPDAVLLGRVPNSKGKAAADQMRIGLELVSPGVRLHSWMVLRDASPVELGALVSALHAFSACPSIGGKVGIGYGVVDLHYAVVDLASGTAQPLVTVSDGTCLLGTVATMAKDAYDQHLRALYDEHLQADGGRIAGLLGAA